MIKLIIYLLKEKWYHRFPVKRYYSKEELDFLKSLKIKYPNLKQQDMIYWLDNSNPLERLQ